MHLILFNLLLQNYTFKNYFCIIFPLYIQYKSWITVIEVL